MIDTKSLVERARKSEDGEAYAAVAKGSGFRIGVVARTARGGDPGLFVEVVLDPIPERPHVDPRRLAEQGGAVARLEARGYAIACDDDSTITCERAVDPEGAAEEVRAAKRLLGYLRTAPGRRSTALA